MSEGNLAPSSSAVRFINQNKSNAEGELNHEESVSRLDCRGPGSP